MQFKKGGGGGLSLRLEREYLGFFRRGECNLSPLKGEAGEGSCRWKKKIFVVRKGGKVLYTRQRGGQKLSMGKLNHFYGEGNERMR